MGHAELCFLPANELANHIRRRDLSAREVMAAHLDQIESVNPAVNAIITLLPERAMESAAAADEAMAHGEPVGPLHGLPIAHKDLIDTAGIRTTYGSPIFRDPVPKQDSLIVERLRDTGAITIGKTNTPEFGSGYQTYNEVFGETLNPYDLTKTCGGSSGGAAVALACGMLPIADGSDTGGSLRNPASFSNVIGFRVSPGRVPSWPAPVGWFPISTPGPMARTVQDVALLLSAMAGPDDRSPSRLSSRANVSANRWNETSTASRSHGAVTWPASRSIRASPRCSMASAASLKTLAVSLRMANPISVTQTRFSRSGVHGALNWDSARCWGSTATRSKRQSSGTRRPGPS